MSADGTRVRPQNARPTACEPARAATWIPGAGSTGAMLLALALSAAPARAADDEAARALVAQRIQLVSRLMSDSAASQRIAASGNAQAVAHLDEGRVHHAMAEDLMARGDLAGARRAIDDALRHLSQARRLAPDGNARRTAAQQRHEQLMGSLERLIEAWRQRMGDTAQSDGGDMASALGLIEVARGQAREGRYEESTLALKRAEGHVLAGMNRTLHAVTLDYTLRPSSPQEEFAQELSRQRGFADLLPLAVRELRPRADAQALIDRYAEASATLLTQAQQQQRAGDMVQAVAHLRNSTLYLQRALQAAGVIAPLATESPP